MTSAVWWGLGATVTVIGGLFAVTVMSAFAILLVTALVPAILVGCCVIAYKARF